MLVRNDIIGGCVSAFVSTCNPMKLVNSLLRKLSERKQVQTMLDLQNDYWTM